MNHVSKAITMLNLNHIFSLLPIEKIGVLCLAGKMHSFHYYLTNCGCAFVCFISTTSKCLFKFGPHPIAHCIARVDTYTFNWSASAVGPSIPVRSTPAPFRFINSSVDFLAIILLYMLGYTVYEPMGGGICWYWWCAMCAEKGMLVSFG